MSQMQFLESIDSGSNYNFGEKMMKPSAPRSLFDLSHLNSLTIPKEGLVVPIALIETIPNDDMDIQVECLLRVMPQVVPLYSRQRLYVYGFYSRLGDLYQNFNTFMTKGYSGNVIKTIPILDDSNNNVEYANSQTIGTDSLGDFMGLPIGASLTSLVHNGAACISALPFMMYMRIWRDYFMNKNHYIDNRDILPDDDSRFRMNDDGEILSFKDNNHTLEFNIHQKVNGGFFYDSNDSTKGKFQMFVHDYPMDYFQSALPFTQRGDTPTIKPNVNVNWEDVVSKVLDSGVTHEGFALSIDSTDKTIFSPKNFLNKNGDSANFNPALNISNTLLPLNASNFYTDSHRSNLLDSLNKIKVTGFEITLNQIRELAVKQTELEKMAHTDGSYGQFGLTFFGEKSKNATDFRPVYIGGTYKNIVFTEVLQTSGSSVGTTDPSSSSPLGAFAGHGITGIQQGNIGHIHCDDYGYIMLLACIMPDVYYSQGIERLWTRSLQSDFFVPERAKLGMVPILNKELFYAGNNGNSQGQDNYVWAYQDPFDEFRYIPNKIHGKIADPNSLSFFPYTQSRKFTQLPNWGEAFSHASDVRADNYFASSEDHYSAQFKFNIRAVRPLPYRSIPAKII